MSSASCRGEICTLCREPAAKKVEESIFRDDAYPQRHPLTAYVCGPCFGRIMAISPPPRTHPHADATRRATYAACMRVCTRFMRRSVGVIERSIAYAIRCELRGLAFDNGDLDAIDNTFTDVGGGDG